MLSAVLLLVGCSGNEYEDWQSPQSHEAEDAIVIPGLSASAVDVINFNDVTLSDDFDLIAYTLSGNLPDGFSVMKATMLKARCRAKPSAIISVLYMAFVLWSVRQMQR